MEIRGGGGGPIHHSNRDSQKPHVNLDEELWQDHGEVHDIPKLDTFPEETKKILLKYGDVFKSSLSKARKMKTQTFPDLIQRLSVAPFPCTGRTPWTSCSTP